MKKKLLSLVLAGAMVASTSVSAFADDKDITVGSNGTEQQVDITGNIANNTNQILPGTITVTVPTSMSFTINKEGQIEGGDINITNKSTEKVEVVAREFVDSTPDSGIIVKKEGDLTGATNGDNKRYVSLTLVGQNSVGLTSNKTKTGLVDLSNGNEIETSANTSLGTILPQGNLRLSLTGTAKDNGSGTYEAPTTAISDKFTLTLKIQKAR